LWLENSESDAEKYFSIGHGDYSDEHGFEPSYIVWALLNGRIATSWEVEPDSGDDATHGSLWGHSQCDRAFKGRFEPQTGRITIVKPCSWAGEENEDWYIKYELLPRLEKRFGKLERKNIFVF